MIEFIIAYQFQNDKNKIKRLQEISLDSSSNFGLKIENKILPGSKAWFKEIEKNVLNKKTLKGIISKVYMSGHNDFPEFEIQSNDKSTWVREGEEKLYKVGKHIELDYVIQKFKRPSDILGPNTKIVLEIRIEE